MNRPRDLITELFLALRDLPAERWEAELLERCPDEQAVRQKVLKMLRLERQLPAGDEPDGEVALDPPEEIASPLAGRPHYTFLEELGAGGMGIVYRVRDERIGRCVALKIPRESVISSDDAQWIGRFVQEAQVCAALTLPGVLPIYELDEDDAGLPYYTMRLLEHGETLESMLAAHTTSTFQSRTALVDAVTELAEIVAEVDAYGVLHRDLKPSNIVIGRYGRVTLIDWGLAFVESDGPDRLDAVLQAALEERLQKGIETQGALGTVPYMAPELFEDLDARGDASGEVFALGVMLFEALVGERPKPDDLAAIKLTRTKAWPPNPRDLNPSVPDGLSEICRRALAREPENRYADAHALARALRRWQNDHATEALIAVERTAIDRALVLADAAPPDRRAHHAQIAIEAIGRLPPEATERDELLARAQTLLERAQAEAGRRAARRAALMVGSTAAVIVIALAGFLWGVARDRDEKATLYRRLAKLTDAQRTSTLLSEGARLWPASDDAEQRALAWLRAAEDVVSREPDHRAALATLRRSGRAGTEPVLDPVSAEDLSSMLRDEQELVDALRERGSLIEAAGPRTRANLEDRLRRVRRQIADLRASAPVPPTFADSESRWRYAELTRILGALDRLRAPGGMIDRVRRQREVASLSAAWRPAWQDVQSRIAKDTRFDGVSVVPDDRLVPLGPDPISGLEEFALLHTGVVPRRQPERALDPRPGDAVVMVLVPPGEHVRWFPHRVEDKEVPDVDTGADPSDALAALASKLRTNVPPGMPADISGAPGPRTVFLDAFYVGKWELTQDQWMRMARLDNPSHERAGERIGVTLLNPVESVTWHEAREVGARYGLRLPTEAEWEHASRGGRDGWRPFYRSDGNGGWLEITAFDELGAWMNTADATLYDGNDGGVRANRNVRDEHHFHAPIGSYAPNPFGLHEVLGNVSEWCLDCMDSLAYLYAAPRNPAGSQARYEPAERIHRGGSWAHEAEHVITARRRGRHPGQRDRTIGVRFVYPMTKR